MRLVHKNPTGQSWDKPEHDERGDAEFGDSVSRTAQEDRETDASGVSPMHGTSQPDTRRSPPGHDALRADLATFLSSPSHSQQLAQDS